MRFVKETVKTLFYRPFGVSIGERSYIRRPYSIAGRKYVRIGNRTSIRGDLHIEAITKYAGITYKPTIEIGDNVYIGGHAYLTAVDRISIGDGCVLSEYVYITDEIHGFDPQGGLIMEQALASKGPVTIGRNCFLGFRVAVMPGVTLGEHCVVGANSTVTRSFPAYSMLGGSPARILKRYSQIHGNWERPSDGSH
ncbi:acyltransferase [Edaphobacter albus]|uniref:acyltransferase n=1 Tax=Edaphobacter sp. 4G125 TaxID=2763071 RepID=UPI001645922E|nr:acyltransferase [Edaphobacter sp. 4G125]QNI37173.1 acyltransferase [Edaphobacter sp. 4G125]